MLPSKNKLFFFLLGHVDVYSGDILDMQVCTVEQPACSDPPPCPLPPPPSSFLLLKSNTCLSNLKTGVVLGQEFICLKIWRERGFRKSLKRD